MSKRIFVTRKLPGTALNRLSQLHSVKLWDQETPPSQEDIIENARDCSGLISLLSDGINKDVISALPKLEIIAQYAVGYNNIDLKEATNRGIIVTNTPGVLTETTADLTWALILSASRRIVESDNYVRTGMWRVAWGPEMLLGVDIYKATIGIIGMGRIGYAVAKRAKGFDMRILFHSRSENEITRDAVNSLNAEHVDLRKLLAESDIVSIHVPLTEETHHLISTAELSIMKPSAILINTSRGPVINELDLYQALKSRTIFAAGLDVFDIEPVPKNHPLLKLTNVVMLPHIGSATVKTRERMAEIAVENMIIGLKGEIPPNLVNHDLFGQE